MFNGEELVVPGASCVNHAVVCVGAFVHRYFVIGLKSGCSVQVRAEEMELEALVREPFKSDHVLHLHLGFLDFEVLEVHLVILNISCFLSWLKIELIPLTYSPFS